MPMARLTIAFFVAFALILASGVADASSPIPSPGLGTNKICVDGLGICRNRDEEECKYACYKKWEFFDPQAQGYCLDTPGFPPLCYCQHTCAN